MGGVKYILNNVKQYGFKNYLHDVVDRFNFFARRYYSELGEDIILERYCRVKNGFYVDVGAYHPKRISVTRLFYERGYCGINIEPNPDSIKAFNKMRKRDINLNIGVSDEVGELNYYYYGKRHTGNTFDAERHKKMNWKAQKIIKIKVDTLNNILDKYLPKGMIIDFLTIDVEGYEFKILQALNYEKYSPRHILVEDLTFLDKNKNFMEFINSELYNFLHSKGYIVVAKTWYTILFKKIE